jgi:hypothetical protein
MSAIARKRRSEVQQQPLSYNPNPNIAVQSQAQQQQQNAKPMGTGLTLPQVISVIDNRLIALENYVKESKSEKPENKTLDVISELPADFVEEIETRFNMLAREISDLKDVIVKLQSFTMDVNKTLFEERIHILSDLGETTRIEDIEQNTEQEDSV